MTSAVSPRDRALLSEVGRRGRLWSPSAEPTLISRGAENTTWAVEDYIVRYSDDVESVSREVELLNALARATSTPTPTPDLHEADLGIFAYRRLRGTPLMHLTQRTSPAILAALIDALSALRECLPASRLLIDRYPNQEWHTDALHTYHTVRPRLTDSQARLVGAFLDEPPPPSRALASAQHNDLGAEHILINDRGALSGILDWSDVALADPARDIGSIYRDLGPAAAGFVSETLNGPLTDDELRRVRFHARCRWLEDLAFGITNPILGKPYLDNAWFTFDHTFGAA
ncbi:phosphotransferase family protein [Enemella sp. A6]|uniref:phosphotransferase family protein n=1 Tax=Enemella sp. A6 TaxID=3440152 RepID=UPI003EBCBD26